LSLGDPQLEKNLKACEFFIEGDSFSQHSIWREYVDQRKLIRDDEWEQHIGNCLEIGQLDDRPVCVSLMWVTIKGILVCFYHGTSQVVDHKMIEKFFERYAQPTWDNGSRLAFTDAMNFHHAWQHIEERMNEKLNRAVARPPKAGSIIAK
jgi:hypothetical protein